MNDKDNVVYSGVVIFFTKGFGFIKPDDISCNNGADVFCHFSDIEHEGYKVLQKDQKVSFSLGLNKRGQPKGICIKVIG